MGLLISVAFAAVLLVGCWAPWLHTGRRSRSSFEVFALVDRLGFSPGGPIGWAIRGWALVPLLTVSTLTLLWWRRRWASFAAATTLVLYAGGVSAALVFAASPSKVAAIGGGPTLTLIGVIGVLVGVVVAWVGDTSRP